MSTLEYMEKQLKKHTENLERQTKRNAPQKMIDDIKKKVGYYQEVVDMLKR